MSQDEVAFLLGAKGPGKGSKISKEENYNREPSLRDALAYELIYGKPVCELFAGVLEEVTHEVARRANVLSFRKVEKNRSARQKAIARLMAEGAAIETT